MKTKLGLFAAALSLSSLLAAPLAMAQQQHDDNGGPGHDTPAQHSEPAHPAPNAPNHPAPAHVVSHTTTTHVVSHTTTHVVSHPAPPQHVVVSHSGPPSHNNWQRGQHYTGGRSVADWHHYHGAYAPPSGYEWVQDGNNNLVLIAIASGIISSVLANAAYN